MPSVVGSGRVCAVFADVAKSELTFEMNVTRIHEDPRVTAPFTDAQWSAIDAIGRQVDA